MDSSRLTSARVIYRLFSFSLIGLVNTGIHLFVVVVLVEYAGASSVLANCAAFAVANAFSFYANSRWNYQTALSHRRYSRFLGISLAGLAVTAAVSGLASVMGFHYLVGTGLVFVCLPLLTFLAHERWTWSK